MHWTEEAEAAVREVPSFVRKKVPKRVVKEASEAQKTQITIAEVKRTKACFLKKMSSEVKGYQLDACFGQGGCPHRVMESEHLLKKLEQIMSEARLLNFLKKGSRGI